MTTEPTVPREVPSSDDPQVAGEILSFVLEASLRTAEQLQRFARARFDQAPDSSVHACELAAAIAGEAIHAVEGWPT